MAKPPAREIDLSDYEQVVNGVTYRPHEGEAIMVEPIDDIELAMELGRIARFQAAIQAAKGDDNEAEVVLASLDQFTREVADLLARITLDWTVTDHDGEPRPPPDGDPDAVMAIGRGLLAYLFGRMTAGERPDERKNGVRPSPTTSSASGSTKSRTSSGGGRSRPKRS